MSDFDPGKPTPPDQSAELVSMAQLRMDKLRRGCNPKRLPDLFGVWLALGYGETRSPDTVEQYRHACVTAGALLEAPPSVPLADLWIERLRREGTGRGPLAPSSVRSIVGACIAVAGRAGRAVGDVSVWEILRATDVPTARASRVHVAPPVSVLPAILAALPDPAERLVILLAAVTGARRGELMGLEASDFDAPTGRLTIRRQYDRPARKQRTPLCVQLPADVAALLVAHLAAPPPLKRHGPKVRAPGRLFPWGLGTFNGLMARVRAIPDVGRYFGEGDAWHQFRRLAAQSVHDAGGTSADVGRTLGDTPGRAAGYYRTRPAPAAPLPGAVGRPGDVPRAPTLPGTDGAPLRAPVAAPIRPGTSGGRPGDVGPVAEWGVLLGDELVTVPTVGDVRAGRRRAPVVGEAPPPSVWDVAGDVPSVWDVAGAQVLEDVLGDAPGGRPGDPFDPFGEG